MIKYLLEAYKRGELSQEEAHEKIVKVLYDQGEDFLLDLHRQKRTGFPEVIFAQGKSVEQIIEIAKIFLEKKKRAFVSITDNTIEKALRDAFPDAMVKQGGNLVMLSLTDEKVEELGSVGIITAGTADTPYAKECALLLEEIGAKVIKAFDFGASGMHRPFLGIKQTHDADVLIIFAGMDGILPTMMASLTDKPIIAVPTPIGYGYGGEGITALQTMLQSCVPGLLVLNIGNSVGAAAAAVRILRAVKRRRDASA
ncbi:MAG TPA: nickel pincer cofactor biosynthesis protein LarB [Deltaproteobacteria bacterium]|nr:nickel pincer cofactor biosynthesis protein LarB [Deltaproteobacteria bacterium]HPJ94719.1 nickel pincer cofactor biosynthesis protein LarB [Deltaproteobacteria bacterium]HPR52283.1 nickel pincer cofactor biosynthesis protein LarB [Deltaproteobacteria bacterium]